jgi:hypothetical protein
MFMELARDPGLGLAKGGAGLVGFSGDEIKLLEGERVERRLLEGKKAVSCVGVPPGGVELLAESMTACSSKLGVSGVGDGDE